MMMMSNGVLDDMICFYGIGGKPCKKSTVNMGSLSPWVEVCSTNCKYLNVESFDR
jgi:hypothetical protein